MGVPADFLDPPGMTFLELYLIVHAVDGLPSGAYHYRRYERSLELLRKGRFRRAAGRLGLAQELAADAAGKSVMFLVALGHPNRAALGLRP